MDPRKPFTDETGKRWYSIHHVQRMLNGAVTDATLGAWARKGITPWGLPLEVLRQPLSRTGHPNRRYARSDRTHWILLSENSASLLSDLLPTFRERAHTTSRLTGDEISVLQTATRHHPRFRRRLPALRF